MGNMMISRSGFYKNSSILFEIIKQLPNRETSFLPYHPERTMQPIRWLNIACLKFFEERAKIYNFYWKPMNIYRSLAKYSKLPVFSYDYTTKSEQQKVWANEFYKYVVGYDLFLETDNPDLKESFADAKKIKDFLDEFKIRYYCSFSGSKGVHLVVDYDDFSHLKIKPYDKELHEKVGMFNKFIQNFPLDCCYHKMIDQVILCKLIAVRLKYVLGVDTSDIGVQDVRRFLKIPFSYDVRSNLICYPLTDEQFNNFTTDMVRPEKVITYNNYKKGLLWRNDFPLKQRQKNIDKMLKELEILK